MAVFEPHLRQRAALVASKLQMQPESEEIRRDEGKDGEAGAELGSVSKFPGETDDYLFQDPTGIYNPYLEDSFSPKNWPFHDVYVFEVQDTEEDAVFSLPQLPYPYEALEPYIDRFTMYLHHDKHMDAYRKNLNAALAKDPALSHNLVELQKHAITDGNAAVRNNGGGFYNHGLFFSTLAPPPKAEASKPSAVNHSAPPPPLLPLRSSHSSPPIPPSACLTRSQYAADFVPQIN